MRDYARASFRNAAHTSGVAAVKPRDFLPLAEVPETVEAPSPYAAWHELLATKTPLIIGDLLETEAGELFLCKYVGFEKAQWVLPEPNAEAAAPAMATAGPAEA
jgi:hypothetical protein